MNPEYLFHLHVVNVEITGDDEEVGARLKDEYTLGLRLCLYLC